MPLAAPPGRFWTADEKEPHPLVLRVDGTDQDDGAQVDVAEGNKVTLTAHLDGAAPDAVMRVADELSRQVHPQADFYVVVRGDCMPSVGYRTGDIIAIKRTPDAAEGDVVMARIGTEITLKCFQRPNDDGVKLKPCSSNPEHRPIVIDEGTEDWEIVGVVVGAMIGPPRQGLPGLSFFADAAEARGVEVLDLWPRFQHHWRSHSVRCDWPEDYHWNAVAHGLCDEAVTASDAVSSLLRLETDG